MEGKVHLYDVKIGLSRSPNEISYGAGNVHDQKIKIKILPKRDE